MLKKLAFIGGSGLYDLHFLKKFKYHKIKSYFGSPSGSILSAQINNNEIFFLSRHGKGHYLSPSQINYRANIDCLKKLNITDIISLSAVGSLKQKYKPGSFVIIDQFFDRTFKRKNTFFDEGIVAHVSMSNPTSDVLMKLSQKTLKKLKIKNFYGGTYLAMEGPQFSSIVESNIYRKLDCDVIGMTNMPEAKLAKEAEIRYCSISMVTDYDCWHPDHDNVNINILLKTLNENVEKSKLFISEFSKLYYKGIDFLKDKTNNNLDYSIITNRKYWNKDSEKKLTNILKRYKKENK